jgi:hypothetical protein
MTCLSNCWNFRYPGGFLGRSFTSALSFGFFRPDGKDCARLTEKKGQWQKAAPTSHSSLITHRTAFFCSFTYSGFHSAVSKCPGAR